MAAYQGQPGGYPQGAFPPGQQPGYPPGQPGAYPPGQKGAFPPGQQPGYPPGQQPGYPPGGYPQGQPQGGYPAAPPAFHPQGGVPPPGAPAGQAPGGPPPWEVEDEDVDEDARAQPPPPPAFNPGQLPTFQGYGDPAKMGQFSPVVRPVQPTEPSAPPPHTQFHSVGQLSEQECRDALLQFASEDCCYGKGPAESLEMSNFLASTALRYKLETFSEARTTCYKQEPYSGQTIDGPQYGAPPMAWDITVNPDIYFQNQTAVVEVPRTASVQPCNACFSYGSVRCHDCRGRGMRRCSSCKGSGIDWKDEECLSCQGRGRKACPTCDSRGQITCPTCQGHCRLKCYVSLTVNFINHVDDHIIEKSGIPDTLVRCVQANVIFEDTALYCSPISGYPVPEIAKGSLDLVAQHRTAYLSERRLKQRQTLTAVPVTQVHFSYSGEEGRFWVYGLDRKVYFPDYPAKCCCGCNIL